MTATAPTKKRVAKKASKAKAQKAPKTTKAAKAPRASKKAAPSLPEKVERRGRPKGTKNFKTDWIAVRHEFPFAKKNALEKPPGVRRVVLECSEPEAAVQLERLAKAVNKGHKTLVNLLKNGKI